MTTIFSIKLLPSFTKGLPEDHSRPGYFDHKALYNTNNDAIAQNYQKVVTDLRRIVNYKEALEIFKGYK